jgi:hypothetical protein
MLKHLVLTLLLLLIAPPVLADTTYQAPDDFLREVFAGKAPDPAVVWLTGQRRGEVRQILGHRYPTLRIRYWRRGGRSAWILEEIGKERPITVGVVVNHGRIERIRVLVFRESRGSEIHYPFFTKQFRTAHLTADRKLDRHIDGISGATLSVGAMKKTARLALYLDAATRPQHVTSSP